VAQLVLKGSTSLHPDATVTRRQQELAQENGLPCTLPCRFLVNFSQTHHVAKSEYRGQRDELSF
jgi:hypothetical protein